MRARRRLLAVLLLALGLLLGLSTTASAAGGPVDPKSPSGATGGINLNPLDGIGGAIMDKLCPPRQAPPPQMPEIAVLARGGGPGEYAQYGYAGLRWTTVDAGCLSWEKTDTSIGSQIDSFAVTVDDLTNNLQLTALDPNTTTSFDRVITQAIGGLKDAFWTPWSLVGLAVAGLLLSIHMAVGRESDAWSILLTAAGVITVISFVLLHPTTPREISNNLTTGVAVKLSDSLLAHTPDATMPASASVGQKYGEAYHQIARKSWLDGSFCGDTDAVRRYAGPLRNAQAFTVAEFKRTEHDPKAQTALVKAKGKAWLKIANDMQKSNPAAFNCWKGASTSRVSAAVKHVMVSVCAGFWVILGSVGLLAMKYMLGLALLFGITFGALMLMSRRATDHMTEWAVLALLGPVFVSAAVGTLLWGYYAILLDPDQAWWTAALACFALGLAMIMSKSILQRMLTGLGVVQRSGGMAGRGGRRAARRFMRYSQAGSSAGGSAAAGAAVGGAAGAAVAGALIEHARDTGDDAHDRTGSGDFAGWAPPRTEPGEFTPSGTTGSEAQGGTWHDEPAGTWTSSEPAGYDVPAGGSAGKTPPATFPGSTPPGASSPGGKTVERGLILPSPDGVDDQVSESGRFSADVFGQQPAQPEPEQAGEDAGVRAYREQLARVRNEQPTHYGSGDDARDDDGDVWPVET